MPRTTSKRFFRDKWRFGKSDPNQLKLPLGEALDVLLSGNDDEMRATLGQIMHNFVLRPGEHDEVTLDELKEIIAAHRNIAAHHKNEIEAEYITKSHNISAEGYFRIYDWMQRKGFFVTHQIAEKNDPPKRTAMLLHFCLPKRDRECMIGDLEEEYRTVILPKYGTRVAVRWYWWQALRSVVAASGGRVRVWLSFGGLARAAGWIVEKFTL